MDGQFGPFWDRMQAKCVESYAMKEVFNMDSSVRVQAIEHLGRYISPVYIYSHNMPESIRNWNCHFACII